MAKSIITSIDKSRQETIHPYFPNDCKIIKKVNGSGKVSYHHPTDRDNEEEVHTYEYDLYSHLSHGLDRLQMLVDINYGEDMELDKFYFVFKALVRDTQNQMDEMFEHVSNNIGIIEMETVGGLNTGVYRDGLVVDASVRPIKKTAESPETAT